VFTSDSCTADPLLTSNTTSNNFACGLSHDIQYDKRLDLIKVANPPPPSGNSVILSPPQGSSCIDRVSPALTGGDDAMGVAKCILNQRELKNGCKQFLVRWEDPHADTWVNKEALSNELLLHWLLITYPKVGVDPKESAFYIGQILTIHTQGMLSQQ